MLQKKKGQIEKELKKRNLKEASINRKKKQ
jgi:hypothetical protein